MSVYRLRIKFADGEIAVIDQTHSQLTETLKGVSRDELRAKFWSREGSVVNAKGDDIKLVKYV